MRFVVDECTGPVVARGLRSRGHDVVSIYEDEPQLPDADILAYAVREQRIVITNDKDFGELVYRDGHPHCGVVLLRLSHDATPNKVSAVERLLAGCPADLANCFVVVTDRTLRIIRAPQ